MDTFGFLLFPGLLKHKIDRIDEEFEAVFAKHGGGHGDKPHDEKSRSCIVPFIDQSEYLSALIDDPNIEGIFASRRLKLSNCATRGTVVSQVSNGMKIPSSGSTLHKLARRLLVSLYCRSTTLSHAAVTRSVIRHRTISVTGIWPFELTFRLPAHFARSRFIDLHPKTRTLR